MQAVGDQSQEIGAIPDWQIDAKLAYEWRKPKRLTYKVLARMQTKEKSRLLAAGLQIGITILEPCLTGFTNVRHQQSAHPIVLLGIFQREMNAPKYLCENLYHRVNHNMSQLETL